MLSKYCRIPFRAVASRCGAAVICLLTLSASAADTAPAADKQVDALFAKWDKPGSPGGAVVVLHDGKVILRKAYGMADIERGARVAPTTSFEVGSLSKQFTAFAIHLLAQEGKLGLDDDARRYLPGVLAVDKAITIRQLLQHTSGLRDFTNLLVLGGWRINDQVTQDDAMSVIRHQHTLNFDPGAEHLYSNSGYVLLAAIVERASGRSLADFARERIFAPLGMQHTFFQQNHAALVAGRALSYTATADGSYQYTAMMSSVIGPGGMVTTVDDLMRWDQNFYDGRVGGKDLVQQMQIPGVLNNGKPIRYASGLYIESYRGATLVEHSGGIAGFRSQLSRFPAQHFSVVVLSNAADINPSVLARRVADIYLEGALAARPVPAAAPAPKAETMLEPAQLDALLGYFALSPSFGISFTKENGRLMAQATGQPRFAMEASGEREFTFKGLNAHFVFDAADRNGMVMTGTLHQGGHEVLARRGAKPEMAREVLDTYAGDFYSDELHVLYSVAVQDGHLMLIHPRGMVELSAGEGGRFGAPFPIGELRYRCVKPGGCVSFTVTNDRVRELEFKRVSLVATELSAH